MVISLDAGCQIGLTIHSLLQEQLSSKYRLTIPLYSTFCPTNSEIQKCNEILTTTWLQKFSQFVFPLETYTLINISLEMNMKREYEFGTENQLISDVVCMLTEFLGTTNEKYPDLGSLIKCLCVNESYKFISSNLYHFIQPSYEKLDDLMRVKRCLSRNSFTNGDFNYHNSI